MPRSCRNCEGLGGPGGCDHPAFANVRGEPCHHYRPIVTDEPEPDAPGQTKLFLFEGV